MASRRIAGALAVACAFVACTPGPGGKDAPLTAEAKAYLVNLKFSGVSMKATESYAQQVITEIEGKITNTGQRTVEYAAVYCVFYDPYGQLVLRERVPIIKQALKPGDTRSFRLPFDNLPASWNNQLPQLVIAQMKLS